MDSYAPLFSHLFGLTPDQLTYHQWVTYRAFADQYLSQGGDRGRPRP